MEKKRELRLLAGAIIASTVLYTLQIFSLIFLFPLQILAVRTGHRTFVKGLVLSGAAILGIRMLMLQSVEASTAVLLVDLLLVGSLSLGLYIMNFLMDRQRRLYRLLASTGAFLLIIGLVVLTIDQGVMDNFRIMIQEILSEITFLMAGQELDPSVVANLYILYREAILDSFLLMYMIMLLSTWWAGSRLGERFGRTSGYKVPTLEEFRMPEVMIWPLFISLTLFLLGLILRKKGLLVEKSILEYAVSNTMLIFTFLYSIQGFGLIKYLMSKRLNVPTGFQRFLIFVLILASFSTGIGRFIMIIIPAFGVSELWISYRIVHKEINP